MPVAPGSRRIGLNQPVRREEIDVQDILWATDGSESADRALPYAKALAQGEGRRLAVVHGKEVFVGRAGGYPVLADDDELVTKIRGQVDEACKEGLDATLTLGDRRRTRHT